MSAELEATMRQRVAMLTTLGLCLALAVTGCGELMSGAQLSEAAPPTATPGPPCRTEQLAVTEGHSGVATGHVALDVVLRIQSSQGCSLSGYPAVQLLDTSHHPLPTHQQQATSGYTFADQQVHPVPLAPAAGAYFRMEWVDVPSTGDACQIAAGAQITPPGATSALLLTTNIDACDGAITTSPVEPLPG